MSKAELPDLEASQIAYHCLVCDYWGTYDQREDHRSEHKKEKK